MVNSSGHVSYGASLIRIINLHIGKFCSFAIVALPLCRLVELVESWFVVSPSS